MRVFLTGATGVVGTRALPALVADGHQVTAVARNDDRAGLVRRLGGTPVQVDLFDPEAVVSAVDAHEAVVHLATNIPPMSRMFCSRNWRVNDRMRVEGSTNLVDAALATGATHYVQESICYPYAHTGDAWIDETALWEMVDVFESAATAEMNAMRFAEQGGAGVVLRFAQFYAPEANPVHSFHALARWRITPFPGRPDSHVSFIHADDAGSAVAAALRAPSGVYNVVDDEPLTRREAAGVVAEALGVRRVHFGPALAYHVLPAKAAALARSLRVSNRKLRAATGWTPAHRSIREGWPTVVDP